MPAINAAGAHAADERGSPGVVPVLASGGQPRPIQLTRTILAELTMQTAKAPPGEESFAKWLRLYLCAKHVDRSALAERVDAALATEAAIDITSAQVWLEPTALVLHLVGDHRHHLEGSKAASSRRSTSVWDTLDPNRSG